MGFFSRMSKAARTSKDASASPSSQVTSVKPLTPPATATSSLSRSAAHLSLRPTSLTAKHFHLNMSGHSPVNPVSLMPLPYRPKIDLPKSPDPQIDPAGYLRSLHAVRERSKIVTEKALRNELNHFDVDMDKFKDVVFFVSNIIKRDYDPPFTSIPPHGRHQHFNVGGCDRITQLLDSFPKPINNAERCRRMIDLFLVSVLLDAGAGTAWSYKSTESGRVYRRSEGIAVATLEMFKSGLFSGPSNKNRQRVDKAGLAALTVEQLTQGLQSRPGNEMAGVEGRAQLLIRLSKALDQNKAIFGDDGRPGNMLDYLLDHPTTTQPFNSPIVVLPVLWDILMTGLAPIWPPSRTTINGVSLGDAWPCSSMPDSTTWESIVPFHKLTQWLTYSLMQPMESLMHITFAGADLLTGLPEYRNGGLFVDLGVLTLRPAAAARGLDNYAAYCCARGVKAIEVAPMFKPSDDVVVEWRAVTVGFLDRLRVEVNKALQGELAGQDLSLPQLLEAGSWKGGREIAEVSRPNTKEPPILIESDGTVF